MFLTRIKSLQMIVLELRVCDVIPFPFIITRKQDVPRSATAGDTLIL